MFALQANLTAAPDPNQRSNFFGGFDRGFTHVETGAQRQQRTRELTQRDRSLSQQDRSLSQQDRALSQQDRALSLKAWEAQMNHALASQGQAIQASKINHDAWSDAQRIDLGWSVHKAEQEGNKLNTLIKHEQLKELRRNNETATSSILSSDLDPIGSLVSKALTQVNQSLAPIQQQQNVVQGIQEGFKREINVGRGGGRGRSLDEDEEEGF